MGSDDVSTLEEGAEDPVDEEAPAAESLAYEDVDINLTAGYRPTIVVSLVVAATLVVLGVVVPALQGDAEGVTAMTYAVVLWGAIVGSLGFVYEYWIRRNQRARGREA